MKTAHIPQKIIHTGQHFSPEMSDIFFKDLEIPAPDINLQIGSDSNVELYLDKVTQALQQYLSQYQNAVAFIYGDTNTTQCAARAAQASGLPCYHFEAGVRNGDSNMPEEKNRIIADRIAAVNYCCTELNFTTMISEGYGTGLERSKTVLSGDLMYDAFLKIAPAEKRAVPFREYVTCTIHRAENILDINSLKTIVESLNSIHKEIHVVMPLHPHTQKKIEAYGLKPSFTTIQPLGYPDMKNLLLHSSFIITDSGGASREAYFCEKKAVIVMERPFWPEIVQANCALNTAAIGNSIEITLENLASLKPDFKSGIFGNGQAAQVITEDCLLA